MALKQTSQLENTWKNDLAKLLNIDKSNIVGYVAVVVTRDNSISIDTNSADGRGALLLLDEARVMMAEDIN